MMDLPTVARTTRTHPTDCAWCDQAEAETMFAIAHYTPTSTWTLIDESGAQHTVTATLITCPPEQEPIVYDVQQPTDRPHPLPNPEPQFAVWYASAGCLPDDPDGPQFYGSFDACTEFVAEQEELYPEPEGSLYRYSIEPYECPCDSADGLGNCHECGRPVPEALAAYDAEDGL